MIDHSAHRLELARFILLDYTRLPGAAAAAVHGSVAEGLADDLSDLDMTVYYHALPPEDQIRSIRVRLGGGPITWGIGSHADGAFAEGFKVQGVECQIIHTTVAQWESEIADVLDAKDVASPQHKAMSGTLVSIAVAGESLVEKWKSQLRDYPDKLARAMVEHHLKFFPIWAVIDRLERRDATLWMKQSLLDASFNILGALAGLNRKYFTTFQFKRTGSCINDLKVSPENLYARLESLWTADTRTAAAELKRLVTDVVELVEKHMPEISTESARKSLAR